MSGTDVSRQVSRSLRQLAVSNVAPSDTPVSPTKPLVEARDVGGGRPPRTPTIVAATRFASPALVAFRELQRYDVSTPLGTLPDARELPNSHVETKPSPHICERYLTQTMASFATDRWLLVHRSSIDDDDDLPALDHTEGTVHEHVGESAGPDVLDQAEPPSAATIIVNEALRTPTEQLSGIAHHFGEHSNASNGSQFFPAAYFDVHPPMLFPVHFNAEDGPQDEGGHDTDEEDNMPLRHRRTVLQGRMRAWRARVALHSPESSDDDGEYDCGDAIWDDEVANIM